MQRGSRGSRDATPSLVSCKATRRRIYNDDGGGLVGEFINVLLTTRWVRFPPVVYICFVMARGATSCVNTVRQTSGSYGGAATHAGDKNAGQAPKERWVEPLRPQMVQMLGVRSVLRVYTIHCEPLVFSRAAKLDLQSESCHRSCVRWKPLPHGRRPVNVLKQGNRLSTHRH